MKQSQYKAGVLAAYQILNELFGTDRNNQIRSIITMCKWCIDHFQVMHTQNEFLVAYKLLAAFMEKISAGEGISPREYNQLRIPLIKLISQWMQHFPTSLSLSEKAAAEGAVFFKEGTNPRIVTPSDEAIPSSSEEILQLLVIAKDEGKHVYSGKADIVIHTQEIKDRARYCFPMDGFDYDRLYLSGKLGTMSAGKDVSILLTGSSYAMVGLQESKMPRSAINLAINAQDPYYTFLSIEAAREQCEHLDTVVIAGGYYFWHTDMSDQPSDYYRAVLTRANYPVLKDLHQYQGELLPLICRQQYDPLLEQYVDFTKIIEVLNKKISRVLGDMPYFNTSINPRPEYGMLRFPFREQPETVNKQAAKLRANGHASNFNLAHLKENITLLSAFLTKMEEEKIRVVLIVPPATHFYREHSLPTLREAFYEHFEPLRNHNALLFVDLFDSSAFPMTDFQDYDHLNDAGAERLSELVAQMIK